MTQKKITTILFDCDNTLVLSESLAFEASADLTNEILASQNIPRRFTGPELQTEFVGRSFEDMMKILAEMYDFKAPLSSAALQHYANIEDELVMAKLEQKLMPCDGANEVLSELVKDQTFHLAVVSGSALRRVRLSLEKAGQRAFFDADDVFSASCSLEWPVSKPDPAIYLHAMRSLRRVPQECVAIEDSRSGVISAREAGIRVVGYTGCHKERKDREAMERVLLEAGCSVIMDHWKDFEMCLEEIESMVHTG
ncbi:hypothetical protein ONS95_005183 [Cadophora gregata]|uniref:uncharacterized protein n=1 Tax=Cadophora gregata TaxID=51156 RepID=UPI0026DC2C5B|nr:uncharacterized protein ONS95_005183 [Cadophora gregata]KAK0104920.1 hypothetical protein ONS95_005183 [Cadophora gregata]KAK0114998.1 hypothetical protein ONS96_013472 [Cadophora gregata f. sp. sojae]